VKILVADDHALIREALRHLLAQLAADVTVLEAPDSDTTRTLATLHPDLDLLLLDLNLPGVGGLSLLTELRRDQPALPIVVLSALEDCGTVRDALARGAMGFIPKSSSNDVMLAALRLVLGGGRYIPIEALPGEGVATPAPKSLEELDLTERQLQVLRLIAQGKSNKHICRELNLAEATVKIHVTAILRALKVASRAQAIVAVNRLGLTLDSLGGAPLPPVKH
jgi:DNA-binding NarL/FixJ family response regulator